MSRSRLVLVFVAVFLVTVTVLSIGWRAARAVAAALDTTPHAPTAILDRVAAPAAPAAPARQSAPRQETPPTPAPTPVATTDSVVTVAVEMLNVREGPGLDYAIIDQVAQGERLAVVSEQPGWLEIDTPSGSHGFVSRLYVLADGETARAEAAPAPGRPGSRSSRRSGPPGGWNAPGGGAFGAPPGTWGAPSARATDNAGNSVQVYTETSDYSFDTDEFLRLLRDENISGQAVLVTLMDGPGDNRSGTTFGRMTIDCNPITIPPEPGRPSPPGNGKTGQAFCNAVSLHEVYHLITLARSGTGGAEGEADRFANNRLSRYVLVQAR